MPVQIFCVTCTGWQVSLQVLQLVLLPSGVSQPASAAEQSAKPVLQPPCTQLPVAQLSVAFGMSHGLLQAPQLVLEVRGVSQPFGVGISRSQSPKLVLQPVTSHVPLAQLVVAFGRMQVPLQRPQLVLLFSWVSQPSLGLVQSPHPIAQVEAQPVAVQAICPCCATQLSPHFRQFCKVPSWVSQPAAAVQSA